MRRNRFRPGDDAVSPVVGVVLLVGIAVLLTGSIAVFVLGFGPGEPAPETEIQFHQEDGNVTITMVEPAGVSADEIKIQLNGNRACTKNGGSWSGGLDPADSITVHGGSIGSCSAGSSVSPDSEVRVIWESSSGGGSEILGSYETS
ncbi:type IV pilin [Salinarchaeum laminariae]|uniref:type IV pilin n=1 Tax=Salinarchaeum laminariae TaxID=869888 RepID=UPI0020BD57A8|nr:type IV pilin [Salinarchaeum laminariae]